MLDHSSSSKLDKSLVCTLPSSSTATYCLTLTSDGDLWNGIGDMDIHVAVTPERILQCQKHIAEASLVVLDGNFSQETIDTVLQLCLQSNIPVFFEPTDPRKAIKALKSPFAKAITYTSPNIHELRFAIFLAKSHFKDVLYISLLYFKIALGL